jgi:asparagine synthase (glutamine-hydrolysing)
MTAAHRLDWHTPFLNRNIVEYLAGLPEPQELEETETALFLKALIKDIFPPQIVNRPKRIRRTFLSSWALEPEIGEVFQKLTSGTLVETGLISKSWLEEQLKHKQVSFRYLWAILMLELWFKLYINHPIASQPPDVSINELL